MSALPQFSDVDLLGYSKRIIDLNSEIVDCTLDSSVAQQELNCSKISRFLIDHLGTGRVLEVMTPSVLAAARISLAVDEHPSHVFRKSAALHFSSHG